MKEIALKMLTPNWILGVVLLMAGYQLVMIVRHFLVPEEPLITRLPQVAGATDATVSRQRQTPFVFTLFGSSSPALSGDNAGDEGQRSANNAPPAITGLELSGIVVSSVAENSLAIVTRNNQQFSLGPGEKLPDSDATLTSVFSDHIVIRDRGRDESLFLRDEQQKTADGTPRPKSAAKKANDIINFSPDTANNQLRGYRVRPGSNSALFYNAGLEDNDLAVALNGADLHEAKQAQEIMKQLPELQEIKITVDRQGQLQNFFIMAGEN